MRETSLDGEQKYFWSLPILNTCISTISESHNSLLVESQVEKYLTLRYLKEEEHDSSIILDEFVLPSLIITTLYDNFNKRCVWFFYGRRKLFTYSYFYKGNSRIKKMHWFSENHQVQWCSSICDPLKHSNAYKNMFQKIKSRRNIKGKKKSKKCYIRRRKTFFISWVKL